MPKLSASSIAIPSAPIQIQTDEIKSDYIASRVICLGKHLASSGLFVVDRFARLKHGTRLHIKMTHQPLIGVCWRCIWDDQTIISNGRINLLGHDGVARHRILLRALIDLQQYFRRDRLGRLVGGEWAFRFGGYLIGSGNWLRHRVNPCASANALLGRRRFPLERLDDDPPGPGTRPGKEDRRRTTSNHEIDLSALYVWTGVQKGPR